MILREYKKEDADIIATWIKTEEELYKWSADRIGKFPLLGKYLNENYAPSLGSGKFFPLTALDDEGKIVGHFFIRYPDPDNDKSVRFGFVIVDPDVRGKSYGSKMLRLGIEYAVKNLNVNRIDLGVFDNNPAARRCYEAVGFKEYGERICEFPVGTWKCIDMEIMIK